MVDSAIGEMPAHREAGLAGSDDDHVCVSHWEPSLHGAADRPGRTGPGRPSWMEGHPAVTETVTGTPLVRTSYTAERLRDCSTIFSSTAGGASPLIVKLTRICW